MQAAARKVDGSAVQPLARLVGVHAVKPDPIGIGTIRVVVAELTRIGAGVPFLAVDRAGMAPDAGIEIDDQTEFFVRRLAGSDWSCAVSATRAVALPAARLGISCGPARVRTPRRCLSGFFRARFG